MNKVEMFVNSGLGVQLPRPEDFAMDYNGEFKLMKKG